MPEMHFVESASDPVVAYGYDSELKELHVRFRDSVDTTVYDHVDPPVFFELEKAESKGRLLEDHVQGRYPSRQLEP